MARQATWVFQVWLETHTEITGCGIVREVALEIWHTAVVLFSEYSNVFFWREWVALVAVVMDVRRWRLASPCFTDFFGNAFSGWMDQRRGRTDGRYTLAKEFGF